MLVEISFISGVFEITMDKIRSQDVSDNESMETVADDQLSVLQNIFN